MLGPFGVSHCRQESVSLSHDVLDATTLCHRRSCSWGNARLRSDDGRCQQRRENKSQRDCRDTSQHAPHGLGGWMGWQRLNRGSPVERSADGGEDCVTE